MRFTALTLCVMACTGASAQWTVISLHPPGAGASLASSVRDGKQVGIVNGLASLWSGTAASWQSLHPAGDLSSAEGIYGNQQAGTVFLISGAHPRASLWEGTPQSWVNLNPVHAGADYSFCYDTSGDQQVGSANIAGVNHASLWTDSATSWVSLHPAGFSHSYAEAVDAGVQVGRAGSFGAYHAGMWTGTAASWIDLSPHGIGDSACYGVGDGQQVGRVLVGGAYHASMWTGTAASWIDLHPAGEPSSEAAGADGGLQVGYAGGAALWYGTARSWVDLGSFLPQHLGSIAYDIWQDGSFTYVVGEWRSSATNRDEAVMWVSRQVVPATFTPVRGIVTGGNLSSLLSSDEDKLMVRPGITFSSAEAPVNIRVDAIAPAAFPNGISFSVESSATFGSAQQTIALWNYVIGGYEILDTRNLTLTDDVAHVIIRTNASRFIQPGTLAIRAAVTCKAVGPSFGYPWSTRIDKVWWTFPG